MYNDDDMQYAQFLRLKNGDDIICELIEMGENDDIFYQLINPLKVVYIPSDSKGYMQIAFMPWVFPRICDRQEFPIQIEDVLMRTPVSEYMNEYYWESVDNFMQKKDEKVTEEEQPDEVDRQEYESLKSILESLGLDKKKVYH